MNIIVISKENRILHISNFGYQAEYSLYNCKGHYLYGGVLESVSNPFDDEQLIKEIINLIKEYTNFSQPYIYLFGSNTIPLLLLIKQENNRKSSGRLKEYINSLSKEDDYFYVKERWQYGC